MWRGRVPRGIPVRSAPSPVHSPQSLGPLPTPRSLGPPGRLALPVSAAPLCPGVGSREGPSSPCPAATPGFPEGQGRAGEGTGGSCTEGRSFGTMVGLTGCRVCGHPEKGTELALRSG